MSSANTPLFQTGAVYSFETLAPAILSAKLERVRCEGNITYQRAVASGHNVGDTYRDVYRSLPAGTPDTPQTLRYYLFTTQSGMEVPMCEQWINLNTIELIEYINIFVTIANRSPGDLAKLAQLLRGGGFPEASITTKNI